MANANKTTITAEPGKQEKLITREFDAPRELAFRAFTDPELYVQWLGPRRLTMTLETFEPRSGGRWRYIHKDQSGNEFAFRGVYHEVLAPQQLAFANHENLHARLAVILCEGDHVLIGLGRTEDLLAFEYVL